MHKNHLMALLMATTLLILPFNILIATASEESARCEGLSCTNSWSGSVDQVVILRESTAIWCEVCAEVDPVVSEFVEGRPGQVTRIALHPDDGIDFLGNRVATQQSWKMGQNPIESEYPTIWIGNQQSISGLIDRNALHRGFLSAAGSNQQEISINTHNRTNFEDRNDEFWSLEIQTYLPTTSGTYTFIITEDQVEIEKPELYNGIKLHNGVARSGAVINSSSGELLFSEPQDSWLLGNFSILNDGRTFVNLTYQFPINEGIDVDNSKLSIIAEDSEGVAIASATTPRVVAMSDSVLSPTAKISLSLLIIGLLLASPLMNTKKISKNDGNEKLAAESEE